MSAIATTSYSPSNSGSGVMTKTGLGSAKTALAAPPPLVAPSSVPVFAPAPAPAPLENREKRREKMMTLSRKFGTSRLAVTSLGIEGDFNSDEKAESAVRRSFARVVVTQWHTTHTTRMCSMARYRLMRSWPR
jgi:hypothetical protein